MLIDGGDSGSGSGGSGGGGGSSEDVGKLTRKRLNGGLPGRKQGTVRIQVGLPLSLICRYGFGFIAAESITTTRSYQ